MYLMHVVERYAAFKGKEISSHAILQMNFDDATLNEMT